MQGTYIPETNYVPREHGVAAILLFLFMVLISLLAVIIIIIIIIIIVICHLLNGYKNNSAFVYCLRSTLQSWKQSTAIWILRCYYYLSRKNLKVCVVKTSVIFDLQP